MPQTIRTKSYIVWQLLDTFDNHIEVRTDASARFLIMSIFDFVNFLNGTQYSAAYNSTGTQFTADVHLSQGCAVYVFVIVNLATSPNIVYPDITATYAPTPFLTGVCGSGVISCVS